MPRTAGLVPPEAVIADSTEYLLNTQVGPTRLIELFVPKDSGMSAFIKSNTRMIDAIVTGGIIRGESTAKIGRALRDQLPQRMQSQSLALARTAIQDYNRQVKEAVWNANSDCLLYTSPSPRDLSTSRMPSSA